MLYRVVLVTFYDGIVLGMSILCWGNLMKKGPLLEFWVENIKKYKIDLNILKLLYLKFVCPVMTS